ncbi:tectonic-like complex member MKS1 isoform X2 [Prorops nasuta]|uniref:tectonic-like complex member MKS1 isoform X2 n=1 Tax=Prorops nasuta TaxID=863751 RepID=UPI0034CD5B6B
MYVQRVKIVQQKSPLAELLENEGDSKDPNFLLEEEYIFSWQEKVFGPSEVKFYRDEKNSRTDYGKKCREEVIDQDKTGSYLYSWTENDPLVAVARVRESLLTSSNYESELAMKNRQALPSLHNRKPFSERLNKRVIDDRSNDSTSRSNHFVYSESSSMHILADLSRKDQQHPSDSPTDSEDSQTLLCTLTYDKARKILIVQPDFTSNQNFYSIDSKSGISYDYWIEHASEKRSSPELQQRMENLQREIQPLSLNKKIELFQEMQLPAFGILNIFLNLDILSAHEFDYNGLFIAYYVELKPNWDSSEKQKLLGRTQKCNLKKKSAYFGYSADIPLEFHYNSTLESYSTTPFWPRLLFTVSSLDKWTRYRTEGYAAITLPVLPGSYNLTVRTWRPAGNFIDRLRRFFTGGTYELEDLTYIGIPANQDDNNLNKLNLKVLPSGYINLTLNITHQDRNYSKHFRQEHREFKNLETDNLLKNVESVFEQFKVARERMIQIRAGHF